MLTKDSADSRKVSALYQARTTWIIRFEKDFVSARTQHKLRRAKLQEQVNTEPNFRHDLMPTRPAGTAWTPLCDGRLT